jgi:hypothetical protein
MSAVALEIRTMTERLALEAALDYIIFSDVAEQDISYAARNLKDRLEALLLRKAELSHAVQEGR